MKRLEGKESDRVVRAFRRLGSKTNPNLPEAFDPALMKRMVFFNRTTQIERMEEIHRFSGEVIALAGIEAPATLGVLEFEPWPHGNGWEPYETLTRQLRQSPLFRPPSVIDFGDGETDQLHGSLGILNLFSRAFFVFWNEGENVYGQWHSGDCYLLARS